MGDSAFLPLQAAALDLLDVKDIAIRGASVLVIDQKPIDVWVTSGLAKGAALSALAPEMASRPDGREPPAITFINAEDRDDAIKRLHSQRVDAIMMGADNIDDMNWLQDGTIDLPILAIAKTNDIDLALHAIGSGADDVLLPSDLSETETLWHRILLAIRRKASERQHVHLAREDRLTGLANGLLLEERFVRALARADRYATYVGLVAIDLDGFEDRIKHQGQAAANHLLTLVGERLLGESRQTDTLARTRHHGFTWLVEGLPTIDDISDLVNRLPNRLSQPFKGPGGDIRITVSVGVAIAPIHGHDFQTVHGMAEAAMIDVSSISGDALLMLPVPTSAVKSTVMT